MPRLFVAARVVLGPQLKAIMARIRGLRGVAVVPEQNVHFTLRFIGEVTTSDAEALDQKIRVAALREPAFEAKLRGVGAFPHARRPRVLWIGVGSAAADALCRLADEVDQILAGAWGTPRDKAFVPHLTIARINRPDGRARDAIANELDAGSGHSFGRASIDRITLVESTLAPTGATYRDVCEVPLA